MNMGDQKDLDALLQKFDAEVSNSEPDDWRKGPTSFAVVIAAISLVLCWLAAFLFPGQFDFLQLSHIENKFSLLSQYGFLPK